MSKEALERSERAKDKGWYFDFKLYEKFQQEKSSTHMTPPIPQIAAINRRLELIEQEGGKEKHLKSRLERSQRITKGVEGLSFSLFPEEGCRSPTISCVNSPEGVSGPDVYERMRERGFELAKGYAELRERTFRIGNMGHIPQEDVDAMLGALGEVVK